MTRKPSWSLLSLSMALLLSAATATAQKTIAVPTAGAFRAAAPPVFVQKIPPTSLPLFLSSLPLGSPSALHAPNAPADPEAIPLLTPNPAILAATNQGPTATPNTPAPMESILTHVARSQTDQPGVSEASGRELFDGTSRIPTVAEALTRGASRGVSMMEVARAIAGSRDMPEAGGRLTGLGLLELSEVHSAHPDALTHLETLVEGLWREASPALELEQDVDRRWSVPALIARRGRTTFYIHPIAHGRMHPDNRGPVLRLTQEIKVSGGLLYSEQNLPGVYGYQDGREILDHAAANGEPVTIKDAATGSAHITHALDRALVNLTLIGTLAWSSFEIWTAPSHLGAWGLFAAAAVFTWLYARAFKPLGRRRRLKEAARRRALGDVDGAAWFEADAAAFYGRLIDPAALLRLRLPLPLGLGSDWLSKRSLGMADAVAPDAAARGAEQVHVLAGYEHALEIAWRLKNPGESKA